MNRKRMQQLYDYIASLEVWEVDMAQYAYDCGTVACIAGHACILRGCTVNKFGDFLLENRPISHPGDFAQDILSITNLERAALFTRLDWQIPVAKDVNDQAGALIQLGAMLDGTHPLCQMSTKQFKRA